MDNLSPDIRTTKDSRIDVTMDSQVVDNSLKTEFSKKKIERKSKEEGKMVDADCEELVAIGTSTCGRWVKFQKKLGEGGYKSVFKGYDREKGNNVAWCEFKPHHVDTKEKQVNMMHEIEIMVRMDHPNIVTCYDVFDEYLDVQNAATPVPFKSIILIQELMGEGTLKSVIKKNFINGKLILKFPLIAYWLHQIISALNYMHEKLNPPIIHRDLKADNCFLDSKSSEKYLNVKVGDFGLAKQLGNKEKNTMLGTVGFMAPEVYDEKYDAKVDIYAFGMLMLEVVTNRTPYDDCETVMQVAKETMSGKLPEIFNLVHDPATREVISCCIHPLPSYRPTSMELYYHPIFLNKNEEELKDMLPVEITPNFDKCIDREAMVYYFVANIISENGTYNTKFNLRMDFRDKQIQRSLGLDVGESLEFDLDIYKEEDISELIANLKSEYEESMKEALNKSVDVKQISIQLEMLFKSMEYQMQFLLKMIIGKRWFYILDLILSKQGEFDLKDDVTGFSLLATYKMNWVKASKQLEMEMTEYCKLSKTELKRISKIYKGPDLIKIEYVAGSPKESIKSEINPAKVDATSDVLTNLCQKEDSLESSSLTLPLIGSIFPTEIPQAFYPNCLPYNPIQGSALNNPYVCPIFTPFMNPNQNVVDTKSRYFRNQGPSNLQYKKGQITTKNDGASTTHGSQKTTINEQQEQHPKDELKEDAEEILTFDEVMKYISTKSHRHSKHPFIIVPVVGQSNAFRLIKATDQKHQENKGIEELLHFRQKTSKSVKSPNDIESTLLSSNIQPYPITTNYTGQMGCPVINLPHVPHFCPQSICPCVYQYLIHQNFMQQLQQQQYHKTSYFMQPVFNSQSIDSALYNIEKTNKHLYEQWLQKHQDENKIDPTAMQDNTQESRNKPRDSVSKFVVKTIEEAESTSEDETVILVDENHLPPTIPKKPAKATNVKKSEIIKKKEKENNCNLDMVHRKSSVILSTPIDSHGEHPQLKQFANLPKHIKTLEKKVQLNSFSSQTYNDINSILSTRQMRTTGTSTIDSFFKPHGGLFRSSTYDFIKYEDVQADESNSNVPIHDLRYFSTSHIKKYICSMEKE